MTGLLRAGVGKKIELVVRLDRIDVEDTVQRVGFILGMLSVAD